MIRPHTLSRSRTRWFVAWACVLALVALTPFASAQTKREVARGTDGKYAVAAFTSQPCGTCDGKCTMPCKTCEAGAKEMKTRCLECAGKKQAPCRTCCGAGKTYDPFAFSPCTLCEAKGFAACPLCGGQGHRSYEDGKKGPACKLCDKHGGFKCELCAGKRLIKLELLAGKPYESAALAELDAALKQVQTIHDGAQSFLDEKSNKSLVAFDKIVERAIALAPTFKSAAVVYRARQDTVLKKLKNDVPDAPALAAHVRGNLVLAANNLAVSYLNAINAFKFAIEENAKLDNPPPAPKPAEGGQKP
jgi:hypothetical protein